MPTSTVVPCQQFRGVRVLHLNVRPVRLPEQQRLTSVAIIPARYQSTRLPGKPLLDLEGIPMIARVYDRVAATPGLTQVMVATDDARVARGDGEARGRRLVPDDERGAPHRHGPGGGGRLGPRTRNWW